MRPILLAAALLAWAAGADAAALGHGLRVPGAAQPAGAPRPAAAPATALPAAQVQASAEAAR